MMLQGLLDYIKYTKPNKALLGGAASAEFLSKDEAQPPASDRLLREAPISSRPRSEVLMIHSSALNTISNVRSHFPFLFLNYNVG